MEKDVKMRVKMGTFVHLVEEPTDYRAAIAMALHKEFNGTQGRSKWPFGGRAPANAR